MLRGGFEKPWELLLWGGFEKPWELLSRGGFEKPAGNVNARGTAPGPPSPSASPLWPFKFKKYGAYVNR